MFNLKVIAESTTSRRAAAKFLLMRKYVEMEKEQAETVSLIFKFERGKGTDTAKNT